MTKNAQQALRYLIQQYNKNIRFVLICNYISKIDSALQNEFIRLRFCQLPKKDTYNFLNTIIEKENLKITTKQINIIQKKFKSDIRSMINYIQSNHTNLNFNTDILSKKFLEKTLNNIKKKANSQEILQICNKNNIEIKDFINELVLYIINEKVELLNEDFINSIQIIVHSEKVNNLYLLNYLVGELDKLYKE
jgi:replication factor C subunit 3/5